ncbi:WXG100 family type VII secretion target [Rothia sp. CCM 9417]|uniref:WXG100 family type VII secretion target n=1 Tax=unclassified Rothia (in: high G+C Gram-positive bacteria) TaxID=2689056 RepID=UPI003AE9AC79
MNQKLLSLGSSISVEMSELGPLSDQLNGVADRYDQTGNALLGITSQVALLAPLDASGNGAQALTSLGVTSTGLTALVAGTRRLSRAVGQAAQAYEEAETFALTLMGGFTVAANQGKSLALAYGSAFGYTVDSLKIRVIKGGLVLSSSAPKVGLPLLDIYRKTPGGYLLLARGASTLNGFVNRLGMTGRLRAKREMTGDLFTDQTEAAAFMGPVPITPQDVTHRFGQVKEIEERGDTYMASQGYQGEWDHIVVEKLVNPTTGKTMYLVTIPGTDGNLLGGNLEDTLAGFYKGGVNSWPGTVGTVSSSNPHLAPQDYTALMSLVEKAIEDAGVPEGATISFMGFSQGATAAATLANNDTINSRYRVKGLVTQAGPIGHLKVRDSIHHVDLRHREDYVPMLSGDRPDYKPDESHVYTAVPDSGGIHGAQEYQEIASKEPEAQQPSPELEEIFAGYVSVKADIYSGTTQKPDITQDEQRAIGAMGAAHGAAEIMTGVSLDVNPADLYQDTEDLVQAVEHSLGEVNIGGVEIFDPILEPLHPKEGASKPPVPVPDHKIKVYEATLQDHLENLGGLLGAPDIPATGLGSPIQIFEPELELVAG